MAEDIKSQLSRKTQSKYNNERQNMIRGQAEIMPDPTIDFGNLFTFHGLGPFFSGNYYVVSVSHKFSNSGYRQTIEVIKQSWDGSTDTSVDTSSSRPDRPTV